MMSRFRIRTSIPLALVVAGLGIPIGGFLVLMGVANLLNPDVPKAYYVQNAVVTLMVSLLGIGILLFVGGVIRGTFFPEKQGRD
jgi:hypothetical protein